MWRCSECSYMSEKKSFVASHQKWHDVGFRSRMRLAVIASNQRRTGWKHSTESLGKMSIIKRNNQNPMWKGDAILSHGSIHSYIRRRKRKPDKCEVCGKENCRLEMAFKNPSLGGVRTEGYTRNPNDYRWVCCSCHIRQDGRWKNFKQYR